MNSLSSKKSGNMSDIAIKDLYNWCKVPVDQLMDHPDLKIPFRLLNNSDEWERLWRGNLLRTSKLQTLHASHPDFQEL